MCRAARIVLACWGSYGDLFPYLGLAVRLKSRGHSPVLATCPFYRPLVESEGIEFHPLRPDVDPLATATIHRIMDPARGSEFIIRDVLMPALEASCSDLAGAVRDADLLVAHPVTFAAPIVADEQRLTWLSTVLAPVSFFSVSDFPALPPFSRIMHLLGRSAVTGRLAKRIAMKMTRPWTAPARDLRAHRGLPAAGDPLYDGQFSPYGTLALFSRVLAAPQPDWPPRTQLTGFVNYNGPVAPLPIELARFLDDGEPPIVFTLGTSAVGAAGAFYEESARAAMTLGRRAVLLVGKQVENQPKVSLPSDIAVVEYAPHALLFPRAAAVVHHGGIGTTGQVLQSARPMLVVPFAHDQPDNAYRVRDLGVARVVYPAEFKAARVASELRTLLSDAGYATRAQAVARDVARERGADTACDIMLGTIGTPPEC
jgi:UDP:flavonoid glycosyltransferase YjiC (YdhE family)